MFYCNVKKNCWKIYILDWNFKGTIYFFQLIQNLVEKHQQYPSDMESDSEIENKIEEIGIDCHKQLLTINQKSICQQSLKTENCAFPNDSNFDDTG